MVAFCSLASGSATATVGIAWASVQVLSSVSLLARAMMPETTIAVAAQMARTPTKPSFRRETGGALSSMSMHCLRGAGRLRRLFLVNHAEHHRHEHQRRNRSKYQTADHRAPERGVLLAALAEAQRH